MVLYYYFAYFFKAHAHTCFCLFSESCSDEQHTNQSTAPPFHQPLFLCAEKELYNTRKLMELPLCLSRSGRREELCALLTDYSWIKGRICTSSCADLVEDFSAIVPVVPLQR